jgi:hypothetical protein
MRDRVQGGDFVSPFAEKRSREVADKHMNAAKRLSQQRCRSRPAAPPTPSFASVRARRRQRRSSRASRAQSGLFFPCFLQAAQPPASPSRRIGSVWQNKPKSRKNHAIPTRRWSLRQGGLHQISPVPRWLPPPRPGHIWRVDYGTLRGNDSDLAGLKFH